MSVSKRMAVDLKKSFQRLSVYVKIEDLKLVIPRIVTAKLQKTNSIKFFGGSYLLKIIDFR